MIAQPFRPCRRSQDRFYAIEQSAPRVIKIIKVMVVAEQYSIYAAERLRAECGGSSFCNVYTPVGYSWFAESNVGSVSSRSPDTSSSAVGPPI